MGTLQRCLNAVLALTQFVKHQQIAIWVAQYEVQATEFIFPGRRYDMKAGRQAAEAVVHIVDIQMQCWRRWRRKPMQGHR